MKICVLRTFFTCIFDSDFQEVRELFIYFLALEDISNEYAPSTFKNDIVSLVFTY